MTTGVASGNENLLAAADIALGRAKKLNKHNYVIDVTKELTKEFEDNIEWVNRIRTALGQDQIIPYYQPIVNYHSGKVEKYECLMRLVDEEGAHSPFSFLKIAKKTKLYPKLTRKMIEHVFYDMGRRSEDFSINLSPEDLLSEYTMRFLIARAKEYGCSDRVILEIVESEELVQFDTISDVLKICKDLGMRIAVDDFGTGYSNFDYLISLQADYIKIDGSIIQKIGTDERASELVTTIVNFVAKSGMKTIAEFVSSEEIDMLVRKFGVDYAQGYYYGEPKPIEEI